MTISLSIPIDERLRTSTKAYSATTPNDGRVRPSKTGRIGERRLLALQSPAAEYEQHDHHDQDDAKDANSAARSVMRISVITSAEAAKQEEQDDDN
jgi:hypothetical protein